MKKNPDNIPSAIFVVELSKYILVTRFPVEECIFPCYRFDNQIDEAFNAAYTIGLEQNKRVVNAVDYLIQDPYVYDPRVKQHLARKQRKQERENPHDEETDAVFHVHPRGIRYE
jgi:hypothetical protein